MSEKKTQPPGAAETVTKSLTQGSLIGVQAGCVSVIVVIAALVIGLLLDRTIGTKYIFTLGLLLLSIPLSLAAMVYSVLRSTRALRENSTAQPTKKEDRREETH